MYTYTLTFSCNICCNQLVFSKSCKDNYINTTNICMNVYNKAFNSISYCNECFCLFLPRTSQYLRYLIIVFLYS